MKKSKVYFNLAPMGCMLFSSINWNLHTPCVCYLTKNTTIAQMKTNIAVPILKYATFRLVFHWMYAWQSIVIPIKGTQILIAWFQISNICNTARTTTDRLAKMETIVTILCNKGVSFHFDFIVKPPSNSCLLVCLLTYYHTKAIYARTGTADCSAVPVKCLMSAAQLRRAWFMRALQQADAGGFVDIFAV